MQRKREIVSDARKKVFTHSKLFFTVLSLTLTLSHKFLSWSRCVGCLSGFCSRDWSLQSTIIVLMRRCHAILMQSDARASFKDQFSFLDERETHRLHCDIFVNKLKQLQQSSNARNCRMAHGSRTKSKTAHMLLSHANESVEKQTKLVEIRISENHTKFKMIKESVSEKQNWLTNQN